MATKRRRNNAWAYTVRRKNLLPKPIHLTFKDEEEGDVYVAHLEKLLDKGIVPPEFLVSASSVSSIRALVIEYTLAKDCDQRCVVSAELSPHSCRLKHSRQQL